MLSTGGCRLALMVVLFGVVMGQMTFTDNWQKRAPARPQWSPLDDPCEPVTALDRLREIQKLQRQILLLADEATQCAARIVNSPPLYPKNAKYSFPTYLKDRQPQQP